jgi:hypothetical protein
MSTERVVQRDPNSTPRWLLPVALALLIAIIVAAGFFATHRHIFAAAATNTPTATATPKVIKKVVTATPKAGAGATATSGSNSTPTPNPNPNGGTGGSGAATATPAASPTPSATPAPSPTPTPDYGVKLGAIAQPRSQLLTIQQGANRNESQYTLTLDPLRVVRASLPSYGFKTVTIVSPAPATNATPNPTPTAFSGPSGLPTVQVTVQYAGHKFVVTLQQPVQQGPKGIWAVVSIKVAPVS